MGSKATLSLGVCVRMIHLLFWGCVSPYNAQELQATVNPVERTSLRMLQPPESPRAHSTRVEIPIACGTISGARERNQTQAASLRVSSC
jgi:hypothetical protein